MKNSMINKMKNSKFGKFLRRVVGEDAGAVMMEYVIIAVLIAAACVVAVYYFGRNVSDGIEVMGEGISGRGKEAATKQQTLQTTVGSRASDAVENQKKFSDAESSSSSGQSAGGNSSNP